MSTPPPSPIYVPGPIWPPDWSQFIPDAIGAIVTGAIIGFVLWQVEAGAGARRDRSDAETRWALARANVAAVMKPTLSIRFWSKPRKNWVAQWKPFLDALDPQVAVWARSAPKNLELQIARDLMIDLPAAARAIKDIDDAARPHAYRQEQIVPGPGGSPRRRAFPAETRQEIAEWVVGRVLGNPDPRPSVLVPEAMIEAYERAYALLLAEPGMVETIARFHERQSRIETKWGLLRASFDGVTSPNPPSRPASD
jgi:hypothetical protein